MADVTVDPDDKPLNGVQQKQDDVTSCTADVIIIGAGLAGLYSARKLSERHGIRVIVLEARDRVGGRTLSLKNAKTYQYTDLGGAYITPPNDKRLVALIEDLGLRTYPVSDGSTNLRDVFHAGGVSRTRLITNPLQYLDVHHLHSLIDAMCKEIPTDEPWKAEHALEWDRITLKEYVDKVCWTELTRQKGYSLASGLFACQPHEVSLLALLWLLSARGGMKSLVGAYGAGEQKVVGGSQEVSKQMATTLDVRLSSPVISIDQTDLNSAVRVTTASGQVFRSSYVISALPQTLLNRIAFAPPLPWKKLQLIQRIPMGSVIKVMTFYERAFWKENLKLSGAMSTCSGPVCNTMDDTKPGGLSPCIVGFISGEYARLSCDQTVEERKQCVLRQYADVFQSDEFLYPTDYVEKNWMEDEYSGGCFLSGFPPGVLMGFGDAIRQPVGRVHFAGTESARVCIGFMEGALESGERAAEEVFYEQIKKSCQ